MNRKLTIVAVLVGAVLLGCLVIMGASALSEPNQVKAPTRDVDIRSVSLVDRMMTPPGAWLTAYANEPVDRVVYTWNIAVMIAKVNAQTKEIVDLKNRLEILEKALKPEERQEHSLIGTPN